MSVPEKNINYSAADLERYHSGSMAENEKYALEKAALEDPFLSDALEGYAFTKTSAEDIAELNEKIEARKDAKRKAFLFTINNRNWLRVAAIFLLVTGSVFLVLKVNDQKEKIVVAQNEPLQKQHSATNTDTLKSLAHSDLPAVQTTPAAREMQKDKDLVKNNVTDRNKASDTYRSSATKIDSGNFIDKASADVAINDEKTPDDKSAASAKKTTANKPARKDAAYDTEEARKEMAINKFSGTITDQDGLPVSYASIKDSSGKIHTSADVNGKFSIETGDSLMPATITAVGFDPLKQRIKNNVDQKIVLFRDNKNLSDVVVTAQGVQRQAKELGYSKSVIPGIVINAGSTPVAGTIKFNQAFNDSLKKSLSANNQLKKGQVILSFKIKANGDPYKIKIEKGLCKACDQEAERLLLTGPKWKYLNNKRTNVTINF